MPEIEELAAHFSGRDDFALLSMTLDNQYTMDTLNKLLAEHEFTYPIVCQYVDSGQFGSYGYKLQKGVPTAFIIDPQGVLRAEVYPERELIAVFEALMAQAVPAPPVALSVDLLPGEGWVVARLSVTSPTHASLQLAIELTQFVPIVASGGTGRPSYDTSPVPVVDGTLVAATFPEFGDYTCDILIPLADSVEGLRINVNIVEPGSVETPESAGLTLSATDFLWLDE